MRQAWDEASAREMVRRVVASQLQADAFIPEDETDFEKSGLVDSMGWVGILTAIEESTGIRNIGNPWPVDRSQSVGSLVQAVLENAGQSSEQPRTRGLLAEAGGTSLVSITGWGQALGSLTIAAAAVERECGLAAGTIRERAGIESVSRADAGEDEVILARTAAEKALRAADADPEDVDFLIATSATFLQLPSLSAVLHSRLLLRESCGSIDVGGACLGFLNALATAKGLLETSRRRLALIVAAEVHSRRLASAQVPGEFRGLFGDGACAFVLKQDAEGEAIHAFQLGDFIFGCAGSYASSLQLDLRESGALEVQFRGEQLGTAAVSQLGRIVKDLEGLSGKNLADVDFFAIHEPNPRLVEILAQRAQIPFEKIPLISRTCGNLGSASCAAGLCVALERAQSKTAAGQRPVVFLAAVGPGLLWGGTYLY